MSVSSVRKGGISDWGVAVPPKKAPKATKRKKFYIIICNSPVGILDTFSRFLPVDIFLIVYGRGIIEEFLLIF